MNDDLEMLLAEIRAAEESGNDDMLQLALGKLKSLPEAEQQAAIAKLTADYEGRETTLRDELENNYALLTDKGPEGQVAGNNQFSVYVAASPFEHLASGMQKYQAGKSVKSAREGLEGLSKDKEEGLGMTAQAMLAQLLREDEEKRRRMSGGGSFGGAGMY